MLKYRFLAVAILAVASADALTAQDKVKLEWKFEKDKTFYQELTTSTNQSIKVMGQEVTQTQAQTFYFAYTPTAQDANGNWTVNQKIEGVKITVNINNQPFSYDSTAAAPAQGQASPLAEYFKQLVGSEFKLTIDKTYKVTKVDNRDDFLRKLGTSSTAMEPLLKKILNDDALKQMADPTFGMMPNKEVTKGETWKREGKLTLGPIGTYNNIYTYTFDGKDANGVAIIKVETKMSYESPAEGEGLPFKIVSANLTSKNAGGTIKFDVAKGKIVESDLKLQLEGTLDIQIGGTTTKVELKQESTTLVKGSDTNPVPAAPKAATPATPPAPTAPGK